MVRCQQVTIVGLGLVGGSLGMAIRRRRLAASVVGFSRKPSTLRRAKARGAIDAGTTDLKQAVQHADVVVLATPLDAIVSYAQRAARFMHPGSVVTDVGSLKGPIVHRLERTMPFGVAFVGAHPLAGSEQRGIEAAEADLFDGSVCIVTATRWTDRRSRRLVESLWKPLVGRIEVMDPASHDVLLGAVSHFPHLLAYALVAATDRKALALAPRSFRDMTRIAKSDPDLWDDIFVENWVGLLAAKVHFDRAWRTLQRALTRGRRGRLRQLLRSAQAKRYALEEV